MQDNYIIRQSNNRLICFFSSEDNSIMYKTFENNKWSESKDILPNTLGKFTVSIAQKGLIYIFCQNLFGDIVLCTCDKSLNNLSNKILLKNQSSKIHTILFYPIIKSNGLCIIYNVPSDDGGLQLVSQNLNNKGEWSKPQFIDNFTTFNNNMFQVQNISDEHLITFYQSQRNESNIGYREITLNKFSDFKPIHVTSYQIIDTSFITTNNAIHALYAIKSMFSYQILYRKKTGSNFSKAIIIWEGQKIDNCLLSIINNNIYATFRYRGQMFISSSKNQGETFTKPEIYKNKISVNLKRSIYISEIPMNEREFYIRELYVDKNNVSDIQLIPQLYENFYQRKTNYDLNINSISPIINNEESNIDTKKSSAKQEDLKKFEKDIKDKEEQISYMTKVINNYKSEKEELEFNRINIERKYNNDLEVLNNKIKELEKINKSMNDKVTNLEHINASINERIADYEQLSMTLNDKNSNIEKLNESLINEVINLEKVNTFLNDKITNLEETNETNSSEDSNTTNSEENNFKSDSV